jgi:outer membrane lipoprotein-sorting protein
MERKTAAAKKGGIYMKRYKKNHLLVPLFILFIALALAGCGSPAPDQSTEDPGEQESQTEEVISADELIAKGMSADGFSYDYVITMPTGEKYTHKMWIKGGNMRSEMENPAGGEPILSIVNMNEGMVYVYQPEANYALQMPIDQSEVDTTSPKDFLTPADTDNMLFTSRETFDNKECLVYETNYEGVKGKIWIWEEAGMPLRVETTTGSDTIIVEFLNFSIGNIDDSMFQLPAGAQIMDMSSY